MNKNFNLHTTALLIFSSYYLLSLLIFNAVVIYPHDNLENIAVYNHVTSNIYNGDFEAYKIFLSGEFKWYYIDKIFFPINIFHLIFNDKQYFFLIEILQSVIAYFSFYLFSKSFLKNKSHAIWGAILYFTSTNLVVAPEDSPTIFLSFLPYILYLGIIKKNLNIKHLIIIFFIGLNSSLIYDFPSLILIFFFSYFFKEKKKIKRLTLVGVIMLLGMLISSTPTILSILGEPTHRVILLKENLLNIFTIEIKSLINSFVINDLYKLFNFPMILLKLFLVSSTIYFKDSRIKFFVILLFLTYILKIILTSDVSQVIFNHFLIFLKGYNFSRVSNVMPFLYSLLLVLVLNISYNLNYKRFLISMIIISSVSLQVYLPLTEFTKEILEINIKEKYLIELKKDYRDKKIQKVIRTIVNKNNYNFKKIKFNVESKSSFDNYFQIETYKKIKKIVGTSRVASIGVDPMIAPMNDISVIDGYHSIYTLNYKNKFRKIIEKELEKNSQLKDYYDNWGNRVYLFYNDKNNLLIDFKEAKNIGADFIISSFPIENESLKIACSKCKYNNQLYLYKIL